MLNDNFELNEIFEQKLASYCGFSYAVAVDCCTNALILSLHSWELKNKRNLKEEQDSFLVIPRYTYASVPMTFENYGYKVKLDSRKWEKLYEILLYSEKNEKCSHLYIYDSAEHFVFGMNNEYFINKSNSMVCLSFQQKKRLSLGRGGAILTNSEIFYKILKLTFYDGRDPKISDRKEIPEKTNMLRGFHFYLEPEKAAKGILLLNQTFLLRPYKLITWKSYADLGLLDIYKNKCGNFSKNIENDEQ